MLHSSVHRFLCQLFSVEIQILVGLQDQVVKRILAQDNGAFHYIKVIMHFVFPHTSVLVLTLCGVSDTCRLNHPIPADVVASTNMVYLTYSSRSTITVLQCPGLSQSSLDIYG